MFDDTINFPCLDKLDQTCILMNPSGVESVLNARLMILICFFTFIIDFCIVRCISPSKPMWFGSRNILDVPDVLENTESEELDDKELYDKELYDKELDDKELYDKELDDKELDDKELDDKELDDKELDDKELFVSQYFDELEELDEDELSESDKLYITDRVLREDTPEGEVVMKYNFKNETFEYYTDSVSQVTYDILDTLARLFAISYDCKILCVNYRKELEKGEHKMKRDIEVDKIAEAKNTEQSSSKNTVFAAYKHYNRKSGSGKKYCVLTENSNKFKYKGKLEEYETSPKTEIKLQPKPPVYNISYREYKEMCKKEL